MPPKSQQHRPNACCPPIIILGDAYSGNGQYADAIKPLQTYLIYQPEDGSAYALLGQAYAKTGDYKSAMEPLSSR